MSFVSSTDIPRVVTSQTSPLTAPKVLYPNGGQLPGVRCCDTGRPVALDPVTGSTVCSCQIKNGVPAYLSRVPSLPDTVYGTGNGNFIPPNVVMGPDATSAFYHMGLKSSDRQPEGAHKAAPPPVASPYYLEHLMAAHTYNAFYSGLDMNSARRKNATRETTSALKAWLYEHRKNPYPTKGEKIMLAIITRMTLTQVSTWFANARRRLKKENKLDGRDDDLSDIDIDDTTPMKSPCDRSSTSTTYKDSDDDRRRSLDDGDLSDISDVDESVCRTTPSSSIPKCDTKHHRDKTCTNDTSVSDTRRGMLVPRHVSGYVYNTPSQDKSDTKDRESNCDNSRDVSTKPKIWSISEIINSSKESNTKNTS